MEFERESRCPAFHENFNEKFNEVFIEGWIALSAGKFEVACCVKFKQQATSGNPPGVSLSMAGKFEVIAFCRNLRYRAVRGREI